MLHTHDVQKTDEEERVYIAFHRAVITNRKTVICTMDNVVAHAHNLNDGKRKVEDS